ncbi:hypothetical protein GQ53DRAFT_753136 [Thozetella sp. PMI_491]|nr:hypothetical protein GQ53DRAFT_753136 [Thozetella sp. PMI_491]
MDSLAGRAGPVEDVYWKNVLIAVPILFCALATASYILRIVCRRLNHGGSIKIEDVLMGIGLLLSYGVTAWTVYTAFNGVGVSTDLLPPDERRRINFGSWMIQKFWAPSMAFIKTSILVFLKATIGTAQRFRTVANILIVFVVLWATSALFTNIFQCWPVQYYYDKTIPGGHCMQGQVSFFQAMGSFSLIADVAILALPIPVVWKLNMTSRQKIAVTLVLSLGIFVCIFSLLRLVEFRYFLLSDLSSSSAKESIWTTMEVNIAIICGCLPLMKPLFEGCFGRLTHSTRYGRSKTSGSTPSSSSKMYRSRSEQAFRKISHLNSKAWSAEEQGSERHLRTGGLGAADDRDSDEIELQGIRVQTSIHQAEENQREQRRQSLV